MEVQHGNSISLGSNTDIILRTIVECECWIAVTCECYFFKWLCFQTADGGNTGPRFYSNPNIWSGWGLAVADANTLCRERSTRPSLKLLRWIHGIRKYGYTLIRIRSGFGSFWRCVFMVDDFSNVLAHTRLGEITWNDTLLFKRRNSMTYTAFIFPPWLDIQGMVWAMFLNMRPACPIPANSQ